MDNLRAYLGTALKYPISLVGGRAALVSEFELINQSIADILSTPLGTRLFLPEYGSRCEEFIFEQNDDILEGGLEMCIFEALQQWEGRTRFVSVEFTTTVDKVACLIRHQPLQSNEIKSFVYPFYRSLQY
jgi:phage baseplate assembly protein W